MTGRELHKYICEYPNILARAGREGWLRPLISAHLAEATHATAESLLRELSDLPADIKMHWLNRPTRGRAKFKRSHRRYGITLPTEPGTRCGHLRIGLVLHEAAHVYDHLVAKKFSHGPTFCKDLRDLLAHHWTGSWRERCMISMSVSNFREIYDRHRGPYWLLLARRVEKKGGRVEEVTDRVEGPLSAEDAHEEGRVLVNDLKDNVHDAMVFSFTEGQFTGAVYRRGETYAPWSQIHERMELPDQREDTTLLPGGPEPLQPVHAAVDQDLPVHDVPTRAVPFDQPVRDVPAEKVQRIRQPRVERQAAGPTPGKRRPLELNPEKVAAWPTHEGGRIVRASLEQNGPATASDLAARITPECAKVGIGVPASLISRLKQAGFLKEVSE